MNTYHYHFYLPSHALTSEKFYSQIKYGAKADTPAKSIKFEIEK